MQEHQKCPHGKQALAHNLVGPIQAVLSLIGIVAKAADGLAYGVGQSMSARPVQDVPQQVAAQQPAHREPQDDFHKASGEPHGHTAHREHHQQHDQSRRVHGQVCLSGERIEEGAGDQPRQERRHVERAPQHRMEQVEPGLVAGHFHQVAPGWERLHRLTSEVSTRSNSAKREVGSAARASRGPYSRTCPSSRTRMSSA